MDRKKFIQLSSIATIGGIDVWPDNNSKQKDENLKRKFTMEFNPALIGIDVGQEKAIEMASKYEFESVIAFPKFLVSISKTKINEIVGQLKESNLVWGHSILPVEFRKDRETFQSALNTLPQVALALEQAGVRRMQTWIMSTHPDLNYLQNFRQHATRLREVAKVLCDHGLKLGLEYVGPKSIWSSKEYPFVHTMQETKELIAAIGRANVGFHLDTAHWYTAGESVEDLMTLTNDDVVACDINDAISGLSRLEQPGYHRELPGMTGVIDIKSFLQSLVNIGFDGPIQSEPFNDKLNEMVSEQAVSKTYNAMKTVFSYVE